MGYLCRNCCNTGEQLAAASAHQCPSCGSRKIIVHQELSQLSIAHIDCDAFYAALHKRDNPHWRDKPLIVGGGHRGVVSTACYLARAFGVRSAMPMFQALKLCPDAIVVHPDMALYTKEGRAIKAKMMDLTPLVQSVSIDEAYLDLSGTEELFGAMPALTLARFQATIAKENGITISIGLSSNRFLAKLASDMDKPNGFYVLSPQNVPEILWPKPVTALHGIGPAMGKKLASAGISTVEELAKADRLRLSRKFGPDIGHWVDLANGKDIRPVRPERETKSISAETTLFENSANIAKLSEILFSLSQKIGRRARSQGLSGRAITLKLKSGAHKIITRQLALGQPTQTGKVIFGAAESLLIAASKTNLWGPMRLIGVGLSNLSEEENPDIGDLLDASRAKAAKIEAMADELNKKFGGNFVQNGRAFQDVKKTDKGPENSQSIAAVPQDAENQDIDWPNDEG